MREKKKEDVKKRNARVSQVEQSGRGTKRRLATIENLDRSGFVYTCPPHGCCEHYGTKKRRQGRDGD